MPSRKQILILSLFILSFLIGKAGYNDFIETNEVFDAECNTNDKEGDVVDSSIEGGGDGQPEFPDYDWNGEETQNKDFGRETTTEFPDFDYWNDEEKEYNDFDILYEEENYIENQNDFGLETTTEFPDFDYYEDDFPENNYVHEKPIDCGHKITPNFYLVFATTTFVIIYSTVRSEIIKITLVFD